MNFGRLWSLSLFFVLIMMLIATFALDPALAAMNVPEGCLKMLKVMF